MPIRSVLPILLLAGASAQEGLGPQRIRERPHQWSVLDPKWGETEFKISCVRPESQDFFDQGLAQLHTDSLFEAERSFRWVASAEPDCAMAYWGMALANVHSPDRAALFMDRAIRFRSRASAKEQRFLDALAAFYETDPNDAPARIRAFEDPAGKRIPPKRTFRTERKARLAKLAQDLEAIVKTFPRDVEAMALYVRQLLLNRAAGAAAKPRNIIDTWIEKFVNLNRRHPGYYYRGKLWAKPNPRRAAKAIEFVQVNAPRSRSVWHLAGQLRVALGQYDQAAHFFEAAVRVDHASLVRYRQMPFTVHGHAASLVALCRSLVAAGRYADARDWAKYMLALPRHPKLNRASDPGSIASLGAVAFATALHAAQQPMDAAALSGLPPADSASVRAVANRFAELDQKIAAADHTGALQVAQQLAKTGPKGAGFIARRLRVHLAAKQEANATVQLELLRQVGAYADLDAPVFGGVREFAAKLKIDPDWRYPRKIRVDLRPAWDLAELGPQRWRPSLPRDFVLTDHHGKRVRFADLRGRAQVVVFFIGNGCCLSCVPQLHLFKAQADAFRKAGVDIAVISFHSHADVAKSNAKMGEHGFPFRLLADPRMRTWHEWLTIDRHDHRPLYGAFLLDELGRVRWSNVGERPFHDAEWLVGEARRLLAKPTDAR